MLSYNAAYKECKPLYDKFFSELRLRDFQKIIDTCGKNYPTLKKIKILFSQLSSYACMNDICGKDYSSYINIAKFKDKNPNKIERTKFSEKEIQILWNHKDDEYIQIVLMLIYSSVRISEMLDLKREDVNLNERYFEVVKSKTESGIRVVPIADKVYSFFEHWHNKNHEYLINTIDGKHFLDKNYRDSYWKPIMERFKMKHKPHDTRHTCVSMLSQAKVEEVTIKKIVGHRGAMSLTEKVYTHLDIKELLNAINKI